nr:hypothetical protein Q903MT_gene468 [Picea sitchensis]
MDYWTNVLCTMSRVSLEGHSPAHFAYSIAIGSCRHQHKVDLAVRERRERQSSWPQQEHYRSLGFLNLLLFLWPSQEPKHPEEPK